MAVTTLTEIIKQLDTLEIEEIKELNQRIQKYLAEREESLDKSAFYQALIDSGLVKMKKSEGTDRTSSNFYQNFVGCVRQKSY